MTSYTFSFSQLEAFKAVWPCHGLPETLASLRFTYADNGDLVDEEACNSAGNLLPSDWHEYTDGGALVALSQDGQTLAQGGTVDWLPHVEHWCSSSGLINLVMTYGDAESASHSGQCDDDVEALSRAPHIAPQLAAIDPATLREELAEYGAWDDEQLADHEQNLQRILWLAAGEVLDGRNE